MLLIVSLDSENAQWLRDHMTAGDLPNLATLARSGRTVDVETLPLAGIPYSVLYTGQRPADLGLYFPLQWDAADQRVVGWNRLPLPDSLFERADRAGKRVVVLDPPEWGTPKLRHSYAASGLQFRARVLLHSWSSDAVRTTDILRRLGPAPRADEIFGATSVSDLRYLRSSLLQAPGRLGAAALDCLRHGSPDCLWITCCGMHLAGHQFFHLPSIRDSEERRELESTRLELAKGYDRVIGSLVAALPPGSRVLVAYAKGMGRVTEWSDLLPAMLGRILHQNRGEQPSRLLRRFLPRSFRRWAASSLSDRQALAVMARVSNPRADWARTRAFCLPTDCSGFIRFNLAGRERFGILAASEVRELQQEIAAGLQTFTDLDGQPCIESIRTPAEMFGAGRRLDQFPDMVVFWKQRPDARSGGVRSLRFGEIRRAADVIGRSGNHCRGAFAILAGGAPSARPQDVMHTEDIPATFLAGMGLSAEGLAGQSFWT